MSVEGPTLDFSSSHDLKVVRLSPMMGSMLSVEPAWDSLSPSQPLDPHPHSLKKRERGGERERERKGAGGTEE